MGWLPALTSRACGAEVNDRALPSVSVIIPSFNCAAFLPAAIESVLAQSYGSLEIIVVDDGSTDDTQAAVAPYLDRIHFVRQENRGLPGARNTGIRAARAEFIALLDADDVWLPQKLAHQMPRFTEREICLVYSDFAVRYADGRYQSSYLVNRPLASEGSIFAHYIQSRFLFPSTMVFRRACLEACGLFDEEMLACEDIELFARMALRWKVGWVNEPLMVRYEGSHNITANSDKLSRYTILALRKILAKEKSIPDADCQVVYRELAQQYAWRGSVSLTEAKMAEARRCFLMAVWYQPRRCRACLPLLAASLLPGSLVRWLRSRNRRTKEDI